MTGSGASICAVPDRASRSPARLATCALGLRGLIRYVADWTWLAGLGAPPQTGARGGQPCESLPVHLHESPTGPSIEEELR